MSDVITLVLETPQPLQVVIEPPQALEVIISPPPEILATLVVGQGPAGAGGSGVVYQELIEFLDDSTFYKGEAELGVSENAIGWRIKKVIIVGQLITTLWANETQEFDKMWSQRGTYEYV